MCSSLQVSLGLCVIPDGVIPGPVPPLLQSSHHNCAALETLYFQCWGQKKTHVTAVKTTTQIKSRIHKRQYLSLSPACPVYYTLSPVPSYVVHIHTQVTLSANTDIRDADTRMYPRLRVATYIFLSSLSCKSSSSALSAQPSQASCCNAQVSLTEKLPTQPYHSSTCGSPDLFFSHHSKFHPKRAFLASPCTGRRSHLSAQSSAISSS